MGVMDNLVKKLRDPIHENGGATWIETSTLHAAADEIERFRQVLVDIEKDFDSGRAHTSTAEFLGTLEGRIRHELRSRVG